MAPCRRPATAYLIFTVSWKTIIETKLSHPTFTAIFAGDHAETQGTGKGKGPSGPHQWCEPAGGSILEYMYCQY